MIETLPEPEAGGADRAHFSEVLSGAVGCQDAVIEGHYTRVERLDEEEEEEAKRFHFRGES